MVTATVHFNLKSNDNSNRVDIDDMSRGAAAREHGGV
jgi:hypothetical protein